MEFIDLQAQRAQIKERLKARMDAVFSHGQYIMGPEVKELENKLSEFCGAKHCISCASGTNALELVLDAWNIGPGDAVFTTAMSFIATAETIARRGAVPIFVDIDETYNMDLAKLKKAVLALQKKDSSSPLPRTYQSLKPRAIVCVDLFGNPMDYDTLLDIARSNNLSVLEDAAQGFGSSYKGKNLCNCGCDAAAVSFFPAKPLGCYGDGGAVFTDNDELASTVDSLRYHGRLNAQNKNENVRLGYNGRLDTLQAAILLAKLEIFPNELKLRSEVARRYGELIRSSVPDIIIPGVSSGGISNWAQYTIMLPEDINRAKVMQNLKERGIPTAINYPKPMPYQACMSYLGYGSDDFPVAQRICARVLSLPMHPYLSKKDQDMVVEALGSACDTCKL